MKRKGLGDSGCSVAYGKLHKLHLREGLKGVRAGDVHKEW